MKYFLLVLVALSSLASCNLGGGGRPVRTPEQMKARMDSLIGDLLKTDIAFSQLSEQSGRDSAFVANIADNGTILRPYNMPLTGKDSVIQLFKAHPDSMYKLTWVPLRADVARSGDMGFTYGTYTLQIKDQGNENGTYCTIWKKDKDKKWKIVLDTGNEGLSAADKK